MTLLSAFFDLETISATIAWFFSEPWINIPIIKSLKFGRQTFVRRVFSKKIEILEFKEGNSIILDFGYLMQLVSG